MINVHVPHLVKKGDRLAIEGMEYRVTKAEKVPDSIFYEVTLEPSTVIDVGGIAVQTTFPDVIQYQKPEPVEEEKAE